MENANLSGGRKLPRELNASAIHIALLEIDDGLRRTLLSGRKSEPPDRRGAGAIAIHVFMRVGRHYQFRRNSAEAHQDEVIGLITNAIWAIPEMALEDFARQPAGPRTAATHLIAREIFRALTATFKPVHV
ncbi:hypothetical protein PYH37_005218 [Sinorhizobium numidicum]|uniref:Transposase n=1 Tax=Sinorhizobium numidicum TaxID=680248 RepID=A0ABY8CZH2_9HYPH|nr:hypothetical protein [Sinorhizobium numidicum]WEX76867.1 hypothetical protein PYH37_005218 [Sinorhizobium numidicum]WEX83527.1 hypothetical protein PYH38_002311 [Sinorhizobium numidicum]